MDQRTQQELDGLAKMVTRLQAQLMAMQMTIAEVMRFNDEQKEAFYSNLEENNRRILNQMIKDFCERYPENAARLYPDRQD